MIYMCSLSSRSDGDNSIASASSRRYAHSSKPDKSMRRSLSASWQSADILSVLKPRQN